jgi:hypothetical protein
VRPLFSIFFKCKYKEIGTLYGVTIDTMAYMDDIECFLLYYSLRIPLLGSLLNYGTNAMLNNGTLSPTSDQIFNIAR